MQKGSKATIIIIEYIKFKDSRYTDFLRKVQHFINLCMMGCIMLTAIYLVNSVTGSSTKSDPAANIGVLEQIPLYFLQTIEHSTPFLRQMQRIVWHPDLHLHQMKSSRA
jgi:hypothetical protein